MKPMHVMRRARMSLESEAEVVLERLRALGGTTASCKDQNKRIPTIFNQSFEQYVHKGNCIDTYMDFDYRAHGANADDITKAARAAGNNMWPWAVVSSGSREECDD